jgi:undecaprenyl diphosphate synthase
MDGNGRWAKKRLMPRAYGHRKGVETTRLAVEYFARVGVRPGTARQKKSAV